MHRVTKPLALFVLAAILVLSGLAVFAGTTGIISGVVTDATTGAKLSGVNIMVKGTAITTVTDANGYFVITNVPPGAYEVTASLVGYGESLKGDIQVAMDTTSATDFALAKAEIVEQEEVVVKAPKKLIQPDMIPTLYMVPVKHEKMVKSQPNLLYQIPGLVATQPGITMDPDGKPHIRGGRGDEIGYLLEGIPVIEPVTNGFGTNMVTVGLSKMQVYTGGYRAEYGNAISGVLNEIKKTGTEAPGGSFETTGGSQAYGGNYAEYGGSDGQGLDYYFGSYISRTQFERQFVDGGETADHIGKFVLTRGDDKWTLLANQGSARYYFDSYHTTSYHNVAVPLEEDHTHQRYDLYGLTYSHNFSPSSFLMVRPYSFKTSNVADAVGPDSPIASYSEYGTSQKGLQTEYTNQLNSTHLLKIGGSAIRSDNRYMLFYPGLGDLYGRPELGDYEFLSDIKSTQSGLFIQDQAKLSDKWRVEAGLRYDGMNFNRKAHADLTESQVSPRVGATYMLDGKNLLKTSWGKFIQFPPTFLLERNYTNDGWIDYRPESADLNPERSESFDFSWEHQLSPEMLLRVTPFYRVYSNLMQNRPYDPDNPESIAYVYDNLGDGRSKGVECYLSKKFSGKWEGWMSYTWMKAMANASSFYSLIDPTVWSYVDWDQRHTLNAVISYHQNVWTNDIQLSYGSGYSDVVDADTADQQSHGKPTAVLSWNLTRKLPEGSKLGNSMFLNVWNVFNTCKATRYRFDWEGNRVEDAWVQPRFITLGINRQF